MPNLIPNDIRLLAQALYNGELDCWHPFNDALIELGYLYTAERHYNSSHCRSYPSGCHAVVIVKNGISEMLIVEEQLSKSYLDYIKLIVKEDGEGRRGLK